MRSWKIPLYLTFIFTALYYGRCQVFWMGENAKIFKRFLKKSAKMHYFSIISKSLTIHALIFCAFGRKTQIAGKFLEKLLVNFWWKFYRKIEFLIIFGKFVTKHRAFGNNTIFLQLFFLFRGHFSPSPWLRPWSLHNKKHSTCEKVRPNWRKNFVAN